MSNFLERLTSPIVALGWIGVAFLVFFILSVISFISQLFLAFRDNIWMDFGVSAPVALLLFPVGLALFGMLLYYGLKFILLLLDTGYWRLYYRLHPFDGIVEGEVVQE